MEKTRKLKKNEISAPVNVMINGLFLFFVMVVLVPFVLMIISSFTDNNTLTQEGYSFTPSKWSLSAYEFLFTNKRMVMDAYFITVLVTLLGSLGHVTLCAFTAYPLTKSRMPGVKFMTFFVFFTMLFNGGLVASYIINTQFLGFKNHYRGLILPLMFSVWHVLILRTYFKTAIPESIEESAKLDGAGDFRIFIQIILPLAKPVLATIMLFASLAYWNDWFQSLLYISKDHMYSLQFVMLQSLRQMEAMKRLLLLGASADVIAKMRELPDETVRFAMVVVSVGPMLLIYPFFQKYFVKGLTIGAVKN
jgi:putative aldouronate transport system permease protein